MYSPFTIIPNIYCSRYFKADFSYDFIVLYICKAHMIGVLIRLPDYLCSLSVRLEALKRICVKLTYRNNKLPSAKSFFFFAKCHKWQVDQENKFVPQIFCKLMTTRNNEQSPDFFPICGSMAFVILLIYFGKFINKIYWNKHFWYYGIESCPFIGMPGTRNNMPICYEPTKIAYFL